MVKKLISGDKLPMNRNNVSTNAAFNKWWDLDNPPDINNQKALANQTKPAGQTWNDAFSILSRSVTDNLFDGITEDSEVGRIMGNVMSGTANGAVDNLIKGKVFYDGLGKNSLHSLSGAGVGLASNLIGQGVSNSMGNSALGRGLGAGLSTGLGTIGGTAVSNLINTGKISGKLVSDVTGNVLHSGKLFGIGGANGKNFFKSAPGAINPYALGASVLGSALGAALGPSNEYNGKYGGITQGMDTAYDLLSAGANFIPGIGQGLSGVMALNKGLSNLFGSTDGMTKTDAILGSAFMPAPIKWLNAGFGSSTGSFDNQSQYNMRKTNDFMANAFGDLGDRFSRARDEANKKYGLFSQGAKRDAQRNIDFSNNAFKEVLAMANQNEWQNIRSQAMDSINTQRYAQMIQGGWNPTLVGKQGMKIFNNATNHNIGMRLLSGAALIDNKQMILCNVQN